MEKYVSHLGPTPSVSSASPLLNQECQPSVTRNHLNGDNKNDSEYVSCHLCAIEVPGRFINEHYKSDKHKINTKIADVALERVRKLLHYKIVSDVDKTESLYFCPQCVIALNSKDRQSHEKTVVHKKALTVDKFLYDFYVLYANDDRSSDISRECETTVVQASVESVDETDIPVNIVQNQLSISENIEIETDDVEYTNNNVINSGPLINNTMNNYKGIKVENTPNTSASEVDNSQFCTFGKDKNKIFCKSCKVYVPNNTNNLLSHQKGFKHKEVMRKLKNIRI